MSENDDTEIAHSVADAEQLRQARAGLLRYVEDNPLATMAGALIIGVILARFAFLGNPKDD